MTAAITTTIVETVPASTLADLDDRLAQLSKVAKKLDLPAPAYRIVDRKIEEQTKDGRTQIVEMVTVEVTDVDLRLGSYRVLCSIDHQANVVTALPNAPEGIVVEYVDSQPTCDFCGKAIRRNKTFVVEDAEGDRKRVGGSCVKNYLGHGDLSDALLARFADGASSLFDDLDEGYGLGGARFATVREIVAASIAAIRTYGYAKAGGTKDVTLAILTNSLPKDLSRDERDRLRVTSDDLAQALVVVDWASTIDPSGNFEHTMRQVAKIEGNAVRHAGVACYLAEAYRRHIESTMTKEIVEDKPRETCPIGRQTIVGTVVSVKYVEDLYSQCYREVKKIVLLDDRGFKVYLTEPRSVCVETGDRLQVSVDCTPSPDDLHFGFGKRPTKATTVIE